MPFNNQIIVILISYFISFMYIRGFLYGIKRFMINNSAYKKRKKRENIKEWLFYSRYKKEIPKILYILYYSVLVIHPAFLIACLSVHFINIGISLNIGGILAIIITGADVVWMSMIALFFWKPGPGYAYERWFTKKRKKKHSKK